MTRLASALLLALTLGLAACGGGGGAASGQPSGSVKVVMTDYKYSPSTLTVPSGKVTFFLVNQGNTSHDMVIDDSSGSQVAKSDLVTPGNSATFTVANLPKGSLTFFCDVPGHRELGMQGTLTAS
ncbi:MAG TPA: cupredoxin domain-containing protein [Candidatus Nitrosotalea sp.]|nr:cupredoxin domain-containing protein [Candidatus Nitrosotalea sp.]